VRLCVFFFIGGTAWPTAATWANNEKFSLSLPLFKHLTPFCRLTVLVEEHTTKNKRGKRERERERERDDRERESIAIERKRDEKPSEIGENC
jgi:hypothetical protein